MKTLLLKIADDGQIEALNNCIERRLEEIEENIEALDHDDPNDADNIEAYVSERDSLLALESSLEEAVEGKALVIVEKGLVRDIYATVEMEVEVWDMDVEDDDRNRDEAGIKRHVKKHRMVEVY